MHSTPLRVHHLSRLLLLSLPAPFLALCLPSPFPCRRPTHSTPRCLFTASSALSSSTRAGSLPGKPLPSTRLPVSTVMLARRLKGGGGGTTAPIDIEECLPVSHSPYPATKALDFSTALLSWYDENKRDLPWRRIVGTPNHAYGVWVSEIMLQQTRVATVIDYWERWMAKWPNVEALAEASLEEVNEMWSGLGYYRRAKMLHEGAQFLVKEHAGALPSTVEGLKTIPGVGDYTAGAIASIAFAVQAALVDGNVVRVLSRLDAFGGDPKAGESVKGYWRMAASMVPGERPGDFNQALMELGATVCTPTTPGCDGCPVRSHCLAQAQAKTDATLTVTRFPVKTEKAAPRDQTVAVCILIEEGAGGGGGTNPLFQRPAQGLLGGLWEFPCVTVRQEATVHECEEALGGLLAAVATSQAGAPAKGSKKGGKGGGFEHAGDTTFLFSHIKQMMRVFVKRVGGREEVGIHECAAPAPPEDGGAAKTKKPAPGGNKRKKVDGGHLTNEVVSTIPTVPSNVKWVREGDLEGAALPTVMRKALAVFSPSSGGAVNPRGGGGSAGKKAKEQAGAVDLKGRKQMGIGQFFGGSEVGKGRGKAGESGDGKGKSAV